MKRLQSAVIAGFLWGGLLMSPLVVAGDFASWQRQMMQEFQAFKDERDREFTEFLKENWRQMRVLEGKERDKTPKPRVVPKVKPKPPSYPKPTPQLPPVKPPVIPSPTPKPSPAPVIPARGKPLKVAFYGHQLPFRIDSAFKAGLGGVNKEAISDYWANLSRADYGPLLKQLKAQRKALQLNDWAYLLLNHQLAKKLQPNRHNEQVLITWFLLLKNGYQARIAYDSSKIYLLMPTKQNLYAVSYFTLKGTRYYAISFDGEDHSLSEQVYTYDSDYPNASKALDMRIAKAIVTGSQAQEEEVITKTLYLPGGLTYKTQASKTYKIKVRYNKHIVDFFRTYPQMDIGMYFSSAVSPEMGNQLLTQLKPLVKGKSELEAVNLLLRFVQKAFEYKFDKDQFGKENYLFAEETLHYPFSDCEDRSVLFAWLVRHLLKLKVVGLDYPGHIATAVRFNGNVRGDAVIYKGQRYVVTDPTYINADAGMSMPQHKGTPPKVIPIR